MFKPPRVKRLQLTSGKTLENLTLDTDSMQLAGFMGFKEEIEGKQATRFISISNIEQLLIENEELEKVMPCCFVPETRLRVTQER